MSEIKILHLKFCYKLQQKKKTKTNNPQNTLFMLLKINPWLILFPSTQKQNIWQPIKGTKIFYFKRTET